MAIIYTPKSPSATAYEFGGTSAGDTIFPGPFPRFDISTEVVRQDSLVHLKPKHTITISGTALIAESASMLVEGARQNIIQKLVKNLHKITTDSRHGKLEIIPYGGGGNNIVLEDARVVSVNTPEQTEQSSGVQSQDYTVVFEGYYLQGMGAADDFDGNHLSQASESWEVSVNEGSYQVSNPDFTGANVKRLFTVSHNISANGIDVFSGGAFQNRGWKEAKDWCESRCTGTVNLTSDSEPPKDRQPPPATLTTNIGLQIPTTYVATNVVRTRSIDHTENSYSINETFIMVPPDGYRATSTVEVTSSDSLDADYLTIDVNVSVTGLPNLEDTTASGALVSTSGSRYSNARTLMSVLEGLAPTYALNFYNNVYSGDKITGRSLIVNPEVSRTETHNETEGTINISLSYNDRCISDGNALSENITLNYSNRDGNNRVLALIPVIGKATGPVIQDLGTTTEETLSITIEKKMARDSRTTIPSNNAEDYVPDGAKRRSMTESWNPLTGAFNFTAEYVMCPGKTGKQDANCGGSS